MVNTEVFAPFRNLAAVLLPEPAATDGAHDIAHLARVWRNAKAMQLEEGGDLEILAAAVLLHDCVAVPKDSPLRCQASRLAATEATSQLKRLDWSDERIACRVSHRKSQLFSRNCTHHPRGMHLARCRPSRRDRIYRHCPMLYTAGRMGSSLRRIRPTRQPQNVERLRFCFGPLSSETAQFDGRFQNDYRLGLLARKRHEAVRYFYDGLLGEIENP